MADDENENDYDGSYAHKCDFLLYILIFALVAAAASGDKPFLLCFRLTQESHKEPQEQS